MAKSMRETFLEAKVARAALNEASEPGSKVGDGKWNKLHHEADKTRKELSNRLEAFHGITLDELQDVQ